MKTRSSLRGPRLLIHTLVSALVLLCHSAVGAAPAAPLVKGVEWQPLAAQVERVFEALDYLGSPVSSEIKTDFEQLQQGKGDEAAVEKVQKLLDPLCLLLVEINPESRVKVA